MCEQRVLYTKKLNAPVTRTRCFGLESRTIKKQVPLAYLYICTYMHAYVNECAYVEATGL